MNQQLLRTRHFFTFLTMALVISACYHDPYNHDDGRKFSASQEFSYELSAEQQSVLELMAINGSVEIIGDPRLSTTVLVDGERRVESDSRRDAQNALPDLQVEIDRRNTVLIIRTDQPANSRGRNYLVDYYIRVPQHWVADVQQVNGEILIEGLESEVFADNGNGDITLQQITGPVKTTLTNGFLRLEGIIGSVQSTVVNGSIDAEIELRNAEQCALGTINGSISLRIPRRTSASLYAQVTNGEITLRNLTLHNAVQSRNRLSGTLGSGDGQITMSTVNGSISISGY